MTTPRLQYDAFCSICDSVTEHEAGECARCARPRLTGAQADGSASGRDQASVGGSGLRNLGLSRSACATRGSAGVGTRWVQYEHPSPLAGGPPSSPPGPRRDPGDRAGSQSRA